MPNSISGRPNFAEFYERELAGPLFRPFAEAMLDEADLSPGDRLLDVACGTGIVARLARKWPGALANIVGVDISADMLAVARAGAPDIDWREASALALPLHHGERFDVVVCQQGLQFFPHRPAALAQMRQALAPGGRLVISTWRSDEEILFLRALRSIAEHHLGMIDDRRHGLGDAVQLEALVRDAGFHDIRMQTTVQTICFEDGLPFLRLNTMALVDMSNAGRAMDDEGRGRAVEAIMQESAPVLARHADQRGLAFEMATNLATARSRAPAPGRADAIGCKRRGMVQRDSSSGSRSSPGAPCPDEGA